MNVIDAVREYVVYKQSLGMSYKGRALKLLHSFCSCTTPVQGRAKRLAQKWPISKAMSNVAA